jgi:hypothetical protein
MKLRASSFTLDRETVVCGRDGVAIFDAFYRRGTASDQLELARRRESSRPAVGDLYPVPSASFQNANA